MLRGDTWKCDNCKALELQLIRNCDFVSKKKKSETDNNKKFVLSIGLKKFTSCPLSLIKYPEVFNDISIIDWSETTGIPIHGNCIADQKVETYSIRSLILSERAKIDYETDFGQRGKDSKGKSKADGESKSVRRLDVVAQMPKEQVDKLVQQGKEEMSKSRNFYKSPLKSKQPKAVMRKPRGAK